MSNGPTIKLYEFFGIEIPEKANDSGQFVTDCPFCDKERHFFIDEKTTKYQCKVCGESGNPYTFLEKLYKDSLSETTPFSYRRLSQKRKRFHVAAYEESPVAWNAGLNCWLLPSYNAEGKIAGLSKYNGEGPCYSAPGCSLHLWGLETLQPSGPIFICEGQWDAIALRWLLSRVTQEGVIADGWSVLAVPGASNFPKSDIPALQGRDVYLLYDNDDAGRNGSKSAINKLASVASSIHILAWPDARFGDEYDVEDFIRESPDRVDTAWGDLLGWCYRWQRGADPVKPAPELVRNSFEEIVRDFEDTKIHMYPGLTDALALTLAVAYSTRFPGEPLWLYAIGDPGRGKSLVLESTLGSRNCVYRTSVTHKAFISGFRQAGEDNSLLAILPGRCFIVKDYSNVLSLPHLEQDQLISLLREAFDGRIVRSWGNGVYREYPPPDSPHADCRFSFVAGVTKEIHARSHAGLGERFLKYEIACTDRDNRKAVAAALTDSWKNHEHALHRASAVAAFLDHGLSSRPSPRIPSWFGNRLMGLSEFVGLCRSPVSRTNGDLDYAPSPESGTRIAKQLKKLAQSLSVVLGRAEADEEVYRLVRKVAWDTAHGWRRDLYLHLFQERVASVTSDIAEGSGLSLGTTHRQLHDMRALKIAYSTKIDGKLHWALRRDAEEVIKLAQLEAV
jgi:hypothetical protein